MKLTEKDIGKYFKRRCRVRAFQRVFCVGVTPETVAQPFQRFVFCCGDEAYTVDENGFYCNSESGNDIIAPWPEKGTIKGWVSVYADEYAYPIIFPITYTEGEGLE